MSEIDLTKLSKTELLALIDAAERLLPSTEPRYRCAVSGEYVTKEFAEANPITTVKESK